MSSRLFVDFIKTKMKNSDKLIFKKVYFIHKLIKDEVFFNFANNTCSGQKEILAFEQKGNYYKEKNVYYMNFSDHTMGFFAYWKHGLIGLSFAEKYNLVPVIDWTSNSPYYEQGGIEGIYNPFEYYYEPVSEIKLEHIDKCKNIARYDTLSIGKFADNLTYGKDLNLDDFAKIAQKYYRIKKPIKEKLDLEISQLLKEKKTLAVQVRGVEWGDVKGHPIPPSLEVYVEEIDKAINQCDFEQIFLATDSDETVEFISNKYPGKVVVYSDVARAPKGSKTLAIFDANIQRYNNKFLLGYEVLRDMLTLTACQGLIASYSNISLAVDITKKSYNDEFEYRRIIKAQISVTGVSVKAKVKQMEKR